MMKLVLVLLLATTCASPFYSDDIEGDPDLAAYLREAIENFRDQMTKGIPEIKLPVLDPLTLRDLNVDINENVASLNLLIKEMVVSGLKDFELVNLKSNLAELFLKINISLPRVTTTGEYSIHGTVFTIFPIDSDANFTITVDSIYLDTAGQLDIVNGSLKFKMSELDFMWKNLKVNLTSEFKKGSLTDVLLRMVPEVMEKAYVSYKPIILDFLRNLIIDNVNRALDTTEVKNMISNLKSNYYAFF